MKKIYLLLLLCLLKLSAFAVQYFPNSINAPTGSITTTCINAANVAYTATVTMCGTTVAAGTNSIDVEWMFNGAVIWDDPTTYTPTSTGAIVLTVPASSFSFPSTGGTYSGVNGLRVRLTSSGTAPGGCTAGTVIFGASTAITLNSVFPAPITGLDQVCIGRTITLANSTPGGVWSSSFTPAATVSTGGVVTGVGAGGTTISYMLNSCAAMLGVGVNGNPGPITPSTPAMCQGTTTTVFNGTTGGTWSSSAPGTISVNPFDGMTVGTLVGTATITYTLSTGCYATTTATVHPNPPAITGTMEVCRAATTTLANTMSPGTWSISPTTRATIGSSSGVVTGVSGGTATATYTITGTNCINTAVVTVGDSAAVIMGDAAFCGGGSSIMLSNAVGGGTWSSGATSIATVNSSGVVTSVAPAGGVVTISYTTPGCAAVTKTLTISALPMPIGGALSICTGVPSTLYETTTGGTWSVSDTFSAITIATIDTAGRISGLSMGTATVTYRMDAGCQVTAVVTVNPLDSIGGPDSICVGGGRGFLTNIVGGGTWTSGNPLVISVELDSGFIHGIVAGPSFIVYTTPAGCTTSKLVTAIPQLPAISGPDHLCSGATVTLADAVPGGSWTTTNAFVGAISGTGVFVAGFPDTVQITYATSMAACSVTKTMTVDPLPVPVITYSGPVTHTLSTFPFYVSYQWFDSSAGIIGGASASSYTIPNLDEYYYVVVSDVNGCVGHYGYNYKSTLGVNGVSNGGVNIYPNPAAEKLYITAPVRVKAIISDLAGRKHMEREGALMLDISTLSNGIYMISLYDDSNTLLKTEKLVKE
ncbi:MAG: T9SS type A sorting domain-containing protein [Bacteroidota bacterium]